MGNGNKGKKKTLKLYTPVKGALIALDHIPDPAFSSRKMGEGFGVCPEEGLIASPVDGVVVLLPQSLHAVGIRTACGAEILVHVGTSTVSLRGEGIATNVRIGDVVHTGDPLMEVDFGFLKQRQIPTVTSVLVTNQDVYKIKKLDFSAGMDQPVMTLVKR